MPDAWGSGGAELRALHLGVRGIVPVSCDFMQRLTQAINLVSAGQLYASPDILNEFYEGRIPHRSDANDLSFREKQVMDLLTTGYSNKRIATVLGISERTAKFHVCNILRKRHVKRRRELLHPEDNILNQTQTA